MSTRSARSLLTEGILALGGVASTLRIYCVAMASGSAHGLWARERIVARKPLHKVARRPTGQRSLRQPEVVWGLSHVRANELQRASQLMREFAGLKARAHK